MLEYFREGSKGPVFKIIIAVIVLSFAFFGVESVVSLGGNQSPLIINGEKLSERRVIMAVNPQSAESENELTTRVENLIGQTLISQQADSLGLSYSNRDITRAVIAEPSFLGGDGLFDERLYLQQLQFAGYSPEAFRENLRRQFSAAQLQNALVGTDFAVPREAQRFARLQQQERNFRYSLISADDLEQEPEISEAAIEDYYLANQASYTLPEQVRVEWVEITLDQIASQIEVSEAELMARFQAQTQSSAKRMISHILFSGRDAQAQASAALAELEAGADFAELAAERSQDPGSARSGGQLGELLSGIFVPEFEQAALALTEAGQLSEPVATDFGVHLIRLDSLDRTEVDLEDRRAQLTAQIAREAARMEFVALQEELANIAFTSDDLSEAAEALDLTIRSSDWFGQSQARAGVAAHASARNAAFSETVRRGENSDLIVVNDERAIVLRQLERQESIVRPLEEVRSTIEDRLAADARREMLRTTAEQRLAQLEAGEALDLDWIDVDNYLRSQFSEDFLVSQFVFSMKPPMPGQSRLGMTPNASQGYALVELLEVIEPEPTEEQIVEQGLELSRANASTLFQAWFVDQRSNAKVRNRIY